MDSQNGQIIESFSDLRGTNTLSFIQFGQFVYPAIIEQKN